ncbi:unnamed protein product [Protopolystoma xenopodis]|uniref:Uncharacterized protein n=1 Tax=Protopolystoma xenopodis TaxID=117903 RepID=A0A448WA18_9PLAT|nr:unnamed protein product [Protopolystoma xenopodis]
MTFLGPLLDTLSISLSSEHSNDLASSVTPCLFAKSDIVRSSAAEALCAVARRLAEPEALTSLVFERLIGPEGRQAALDARLGCLTSLGRLAGQLASKTNIFSFSGSEKAVTLIVALFVDFLTQEKRLPDEL